MAASNLTLRVASAAVLLPIVIGVLFFGRPEWWLALLMVIAVAGAFELYGMAFPGDRAAQIVGVLTTWAVVGGVWFSDEDPRGLLVTMLLIPVLAIVLALWRFRDVAPAALQLMTGVFGPLWIGGGIGAVALLRKVGGSEGPGLALFALALAWAGDTGGYFAGRAFGQRKLHATVSPKKTVEGAIGGMLAVVAVAVGLRTLFVPNRLSVRDAAILAVLGGIVGILGDLGESLIKRSLGVKDSGGILPGHGGMLDRIDAVLLTAPLTLAYVLVVC